MKEEMYVELEDLAEQLVDSGLLRIDADPKQNFTRFSQPTRNVHIVFSKRELYQENLYNRTYKRLHKALKDAGVQANIDKKINEEIEKLKGQLKKHIDVELELEMQLARILVQSAHPVVFLMIILKQVQVFVSYGDNIGDVMDVVSWQQAGSNSGMQSTDGKNVAIFVSCGGDPLLLEPVIEADKKNSDLQMQEEKIYGDGKPALARMMGIAGQEIGHYSDIKHDNFGRQIGRYSANFSGTIANEKVNIARLTDMKNIQSLWNMLKNIGLDKLIDKEKDIQFFRRNPDRSLGYYFRVFMLLIIKNRFIELCRKISFWPIEDLKNKDYLGLSMQEMLSDMMFNLQPVADVYSSDDKNEEIAIACIEALARVPQQVNKWGHKTTLFLWRNLYKFYYYKLIPGCIEDYERMSGKTFTFYPNKMRRYNWKEKLKIRFKAWRKTRA
jgi:hypothetical protein